MSGSRKKVTPTDIMEALEVSQPSVSFMLTGEHGISLQRAMFLKNNLKVPFDVWISKKAQKDFFGRIYLKEDIIIPSLDSQ